jgi:hypothetical protein
MDGMNFRHEVWRLCLIESNNEVREPIVKAISSTSVWMKD